MNNLIGISGKINSGKDLVGSIIQYLRSEMRTIDSFTYTEWLNYGKIDYKSEDYQIKKYADKLKDIVCLMIGCTRTDLEDREFKEKPLGEEWWKWFNVKTNGESYYSLENEEDMSWVHTSARIKTTPRLLLQLMGTECGRQILHPNIWVNALFADYKTIANFKLRNYKLLNNLKTSENDVTQEYPNWIITDVRFPNEAQAIKDRGGIVIRLERHWKPKIGDMITTCYEDVPFKVAKFDIDIRGCDEWVVLDEEGLIVRPPDIIRPKEHESETALDNHDFKYRIENNGSIEELVEKVKECLK
jgi:hypothetical protein